MDVGQDELGDGLAQAQGGGDVADAEAGYHEEDKGDAVSYTHLDVYKRQT